MRAVTTTDFNRAVIDCFRTYGEGPSSLHPLTDVVVYPLDARVRFKFRPNQYECGVEFLGEELLVKVRVGYHGEKIYRILLELLGKEFVEASQTGNSEGVIYFGKLQLNSALREFLVTFLAQEVAAAKKRAGKVYREMTGRPLEPYLRQFFGGIIRGDSNAFVNSIGLKLMGPKSELYLAPPSPFARLSLGGDWTLALHLLESGKVKKTGDRAFVHTDMTLYDLLSGDRGWWFDFISEAQRGALLLCLLVR